MISYLKRKDVDIVKYDACIKNAINTRIYAYSWYLDCVADNWDVLVLNDYEAVMPLPWREKYSVKYVYLVSWIQQLGIFYSETKEVIIQDFVRAIPRKFKLIETFLNSDNYEGSLSFTQRINYILKLQKSYEELYKSFSKGRKSDIKKAKKADIKVVFSKSASKIIELFKSEKNNEVNHKEKDYLKLTKLIEALTLQKKVKIMEAYSENEFVGGAIFLIDAKRVTYLFSALSEKGRAMNVMSLLISNIIKEYANSDFIFDFEGSMIDAIASFFKSFGAEKEIYYHFKKHRLF